MNPERFRFGLFEFDPATGDLRREGARVRLAAQPAQALHILLERAGQLVTRDDLRQAIWGSETHVDFERGLNFCIGQVRAALGDDSASPRYIRTVAKRGYEFIAPVERIGDSAGGQSTSAEPEVASGSWPRVRRGRAMKLGWGVAAVAVLVVLVSGVWWLHSVNATKRVPTVAVYRFDNETSDPALAQFCNELTDNLVEELTRSSSGRYAVIGNAQLLRLPRDQRDLMSASKELGAAYAVLGQVQTAGGKTRVLAH